jgi:hypothetical protein
VKYAITAHLWPKRLFSGHYRPILDKFNCSGDGDNEGEMEQENCPLQYSGFDNGRRGRGVSRLESMDVIRNLLPLIHLLSTCYANLLVNPRPPRTTLIVPYLYNIQQDRIKLAFFTERIGLIETV